MKNYSRYRSVAASMLSVVLTLMVHSAEAETVVWQKVPIRVNLIVGVEQMVILPEEAAIGLPPVLSNNNVFRTLVTGGTAYWTALEPFSNERIQVRLASGEFLLFDVTAEVTKAPPAQVNSIQVTMDEARGEGDSGASESESQATLFELIRYAAQSIYSPQRLVAPVPDVKSVQVGLSGDFGNLYNEGRSPGLVIQPYKAWSAGNYHVTAFIVTNEHDYPITLDHRKVMHSPHAKRTGVAPHFVASAFYDRTVPARGKGDNRTTLFIVTDRPIRSVIRGV